MFKTSETRRIRLGRGTRVHDVPVPHSRPMKTVCGKRIVLEDMRGRTVDRPLSGEDDIAVTCPACLRAIEGREPA